VLQVQSISSHKPYITRYILLTAPVVGNPQKLPTGQLLRWTDIQFILFFPSNLKNIDDVPNEPRPL